VYFSLYMFNRAKKIASYDYTQKRNHFLKHKYGGGESFDKQKEPPVEKNKNEARSLQEWDFFGQSMSSLLGRRCWNMDSSAAVLALMDVNRT